MFGRFLEMLEDVAHPNGEKDDDDVARALVSSVSSSDRGQARRGVPARRGRQEDFDDRRMSTPQRRTVESPPSLFRCRVREENSDHCHHDDPNQPKVLQQRRTGEEEDEGLHQLAMELERLTTDWINENQDGGADASSGPPHKRPRRSVWTSPTPPYLWQGSPRRLLGSSQPDLGSDRRFRKLTEDDQDFYERTHRLLDLIEALMVSPARAKSHRPNDSNITSPESFRRRNSPPIPPTMGSENERPHRLNAGVGAVAAVDAMHPSASGSDVACALANCLANLTIHLPVVGACDDSRRRPHVNKPPTEVVAQVALRVSTSLLQRAGNLWMRINLASSKRQAIHLTSEQCCLLLERIVEDKSAREFGLSSSLFSSSTTRMECLATWLRMVLASWTDSVVPQVTESCESLKLPSVEWWGRILTALLGSNDQGANWTDGLQRLIDGPTQSSAAPSYSQLLPLPLEVASALQTLTVHVLEVLAALINDPSPAVRHRLVAGEEAAAAAALWPRLVETYTEQAVAQALRIHDEASTFLHHVEDQHKRRTWEEESRVVTARLRRLVAGTHHQLPDQETDGLMEPEWPLNYTRVVALVVDQLDVAYRTSKAAAELGRAHPKNSPLECGMDGSATKLSRLVREQLFPLWKAATRLSVATTMTEKHGRLVTDLARHALSSLSTAELASSRAAIESVNLTFLRAFKDNPRWLPDSHLLTMSSSHGRDDSIDDDNDDDDFGSGSSTESALLALASASLEVRRVLFMAALDVEVERLDLGRPGDAISREVQQRLLGLLRRAGECDPDGKADPWTDGFLDEARTRGLL